MWANTEFALSRAIASLGDLRAGLLIPAPQYVRVGPVGPGGAKEGGIVATQLNL